jgi:hypothetical protein
MWVNVARYPGPMLRRFDRGQGRRGLVRRHDPPNGTNGTVPVVNGRRYLPSVASRTHYEIMMLHPSATPEVISAV